MHCQQYLAFYPGKRLLAQNMPCIVTVQVIRNVCRCCTSSLEGKLFLAL